MMDKGAFIERGYVVEPGEDGTFIVSQFWGRHDSGRISAMKGFSNYGDLIEWLISEHSAKPEGEAQLAKEAA